MTATALERQAAPRWLLLSGMLLGVMALLALALATLSFLPESGSAHPETELVGEGVGGVAQVNLVAYEDTEFYVARLPDGSVAALSPAGPDRGCRVIPRPLPQGSWGQTPLAAETGTIFRDACSGTMYDLSGTRFWGRGSQDMTSYPASENADGSLEVQIDAHVCTTGGLRGEPSIVAC